MPRLLIVDDDRSIRRTLEKFLGGEGYDVVTAHDAPSAIAALAAHEPSVDLVLLDLGLPGGSGFDVFAALEPREQKPTVVVVTARDDMQSTVKAIQLGAYEYLVKPVDIDRLRDVVQSALASRESRSELVALAARGGEAGEILGKSAAIRDVWKQIGAVSTTRAPVLIIGESGTGKELVAKAIHNAAVAGAAGRGDTRSDPARGDSGRGDGARNDPTRGDGARGDSGRGDARSDSGRGDGARGNSGRGDARSDSGRGDGARGDSGRGDGARGDSGRGDGARGDSGRGDGARGDSGRGDGARSDSGHGDGARGDSGRDDARSDPTRGDGARGDSGRGDGRGDSGRGDGARGDPTRGDGARSDPTRGDGARGDSGRGDARSDSGRGDGARGDSGRGDARSDSGRGDGARGDSARGDGARGNPARGDGVRSDSGRRDGARADSARGDSVRVPSRADSARGDSVRALSRADSARGDSVRAPSRADSARGDSVRAPSRADSARGSRNTPADRPFVAVSCTALAPGVLESELFGHVKGAFTGAVADRPGRFELAGKGTLFLDEIAEIPLDLQAKLLRVLQERTFERVGDSRPLPLDARIIAATHRDLAAMVAKGTFREDLYYRLRVVEIDLPPLRERAGDVAVLVEGLLVKITRDLGKDIRYVTPTALARLAAHTWPGNVRELENTLTRAVVLAKTDVLDETLLPLGANAATTAGTAALATTQPGADPDAALPTLREVERRHIAVALARTEWNKRRACAILDISRPTLDRKIEEYGLRREEPE